MKGVDRGVFCMSYLTAVITVLIDFLITGNVNEQLNHCNCFQPSFDCFYILYDIYPNINGNNLNVL